MIAKTLRVLNYRNILSCELNFSKDINVICGENAQGKTNLLEAIWFFSSGKSFRAQREKEVINHCKDFARLSLDFDCYSRDNTCEIIIPQNSKKKISLNGVSLKKTTDILGLFAGVLFSPEHLSLIKDSAGVRRKFMDFALCQLIPRYSSILTKFGRILDQRNATLKLCNTDKCYYNVLDVFDAKFASIASYIVINRLIFINKLSPFATKNHLEISNNTENLSLSYTFAGRHFCFSTREDIYNFYIEEFKKIRANEIRQGLTLIGPHRDDFEVLINSFSARLFGSQGQQRSCVLSLKIAESELINLEYGEYPVLMLDDVLSELDAFRQDFILSKIQNQQVIITCCEMDKLTYTGDRNTFHIKNGSII